MSKKEWYLKIWSEGKYFDLWTVTHLLGGTFAYGLLKIFNLSLWVGFSLLIVYIILWEVYEVVFNIMESWQNKVVDFVLQLIAFFVARYIWNLEIVNNRIVFGVVFLVFLALEVWGFIAFKITLGKSLVRLWGFD